LGTGSPDNTNFLRGDGEWATAGSPPGTLELLQEDTFTTSGTWTKATGYDADDTVMIFLVGGGGSGAIIRNNTQAMAAQGGTAGFAFAITTRYGDVPSSAFTFTAGSGGAALSGISAEGNNGGNTLLENATTGSFYTARGGRGGRNFLSSSNFDRQSGVLWSDIFQDYQSYAAFVNNVNSFAGSLPDAAGEGTNRVAGNLHNITHPAGSTILLYQRAMGVFTSRELDLNDTFYRGSYGLFGSGGSACCSVTGVDRVSVNPKPLSFFNTGGNGSGPGNGQDATGIGGGGGGCARQVTSGTLVSGAGGPGGMIVRYYRGRVSPLQVITGAS
jgi:hypothetical protein